MEKLLKTKPDFGKLLVDLATKWVPTNQRKEFISDIMKVAEIFTKHTIDEIIEKEQGEQKPVILRMNKPA